MSDARWRGNATSRWGRALAALFTPRHLAKGGLSGGRGVGALLRVLLVVCLGGRVVMRCDVGEIWAMLPAVGNARVRRRESCLSRGRIVQDLFGSLVVFRFGSSRFSNYLGTPEYNFLSIVGGFSSFEGVFRLSRPVS